jgi:hypothetical protein
MKFRGFLHSFIRRVRHPALARKKVVAAGKITLSVDQVKDFAEVRAEAS